MLTSSDFVNIVYFLFSLKFRPNDSVVVVSLVCGSLSGIASSTGGYLLVVPISNN